MGKIFYPINYLPCVNAYDALYQMAKILILIFCNAKVAGLVNFCCTCIQHTVDELHSKYTSYEHVNYFYRAI